ncbi:hypothetical protein C5N14_31210 [Micromonospora sp. MW-13]|nr:hypothetical protein C5N14_31210 [Micromonospora sp. MW-13]
MVVARQLVVPLDGAAVPGQAVLVAQVAGEGGRRAVHRVGEPGRVVHEALVFDAHRVRVGRTGVVGGVALPHHLGDLSGAGPDDVVRADPGRRVLEPTDGPRVRALGDVDDHGGDPGRPSRLVVAAVGGDPPGRTVLGNRSQGGRGPGGPAPGGGDRGVPAEFRPHRPGGDADPLPGGCTSREALPQQVVDMVGVETGGGVVAGVGVAGHDRVPGVDPVPVGGPQPRRVGVGAQHGRRAPDVHLRPGPELIHRCSGERGGLVQ